MIICVGSLPKYLSRNFNVFVPFDLIIPLLDMCPKELIIIIDESITRKAIAALFTIERN